jgi:hypothetical protein
MPEAGPAPLGATAPHRPEWSATVRQATLIHLNWAAAQKEGWSAQSTRGMPAGLVGRPTARAPRRAHSDGRCPAPVGLWYPIKVAARLRCIKASSVLGLQPSRSAFADPAAPIPTDGDGNG